MSSVAWTGGCIQGSQKNTLPHRFPLPAEVLELARVLTLENCFRISRMMTTRGTSPIHTGNRILETMLKLPNCVRTAGGKETATVSSAVSFNV